MNTFESLNEQLGDRARRKVANNTFLNRRYDDSIAVTLHRTDVVTAFADGRIVLKSGGWRTLTTKDRINMFLPSLCHLTQRKNEWWLTTPDGTVEFEDGMVIFDK